MRHRNKVLLILLASVLVLLGSAYAWLSWPTPEYQPYTYGRADRAKLLRMTLTNHSAIMDELFGKPPLPVNTIGILVYDGVDTLEAVAPMVVFSELSGVKLEYIGRRPGVVRTRLAQLVVERGIDEVQELDLLVVPGGKREALQELLGDAALLDWLKRIDAGSKLTAGVGQGSVLLGKAGLLKGKRITFGWPAAEANATALGAHFQAGRYTHDGKYWSSVGGTAAIDQSLALVGLIAGERYLQAAMLDLEYDPAPPLAGGTPESTPQNLREVLAATAWQEAGLTLLDTSPSTGLAAGTTAGDPAAPLQIGILVYAGFFTLDAIGPLAVLSELDHAEVRLVRFGEQPEIKSGRTRLRVPAAASDVSALDVLLVPGGSNGTWEMVRNPAVHDWIRRIDQGSRYTTSVCTGSWVLGAAGLLKDRKATSNWYRAGQMLERFGARFEPARWTRDGKYWTSAGVSAGIDLSFALIAELRGEAAARTAMLRLQYAPEPPIVGGSPEKTDDLVLDMTVQMYDYLMVPLIRQP